MWLGLDGEGPLHRQAYRGLRQAILEGQLAPGSRLPSTRHLAAETRLARNTLLQAYEQLVAEGYAITRHGAGTFVAEAVPVPPPARASPARERGVSKAPRLAAYAQRLRRAASGTPLSWAPRRPRLRYDFRYGEPSHADFPRATWARCVGRAARQAGPGSTGYAPPGGDPALREALCGYLARARGISCTPEQVAVVYGSQQALDLIARLLVDPGDPALIEEPHYPGLRLALEVAGARVTGVPVDARGIDVDVLDTERARLLCVTPSHQFPLGGALPVPRRLRVLEWARRNDAVVVEDDYDSEFRYAGRPLEALRSLDREDRVAYVGTVSKVMFPSLRIGYVVLPEWLRELFLSAKSLVDTGAATLEQRALAEFIEAGHFERHLRRTRKRNQLRRATLEAAIEAELGDEVELVGEDAGLHVALWLRGRGHREAEALRRRAREREVAVYPLRDCYLRAPRRAGWLLGFAGLSPDEIRVGVARLAEVLRESPKRHRR